MNVRVAKVYDGDSITIIAPLDCGLRRLRTRLAGLDAFEIRGEHADLGHKARIALIKALRISEDPLDRYDETFFDSHPSFVDVQCFEFDKYGRVLVNVAPVNGQAINSMLVRTCGQWFSRYDGSGSRHKV